MNEKDLFKGMNHLDEDIIDEAMEPVVSQSKEKKNWKRVLKHTHTIGTVAAVLAVVVLGHEVISLNKKIDSLEKNVENGLVTTTSDEEEKEVIGISDNQDIGDMFTVAKGYDDLYDKLQDPDEKSWYERFFEEEAKEYSNASGIASMESMTDDMIVNEDVSTSDKEYSTTNVMTEGVDESDIVKTDGSYIYMVESGGVSITDISDGKPGEKNTLLPEFESPADIIEEMYVSDGNLLLISSHIKEEKSNGDNYNNYWYGGLDEETICYSYDISDPTKPKLIGVMKQDGSYHTSRKIGSTVYLFTTRSINRPDMAKDKAVLEESLDTWIPKVNNIPIESGCIYTGNDGQNGMLISSFDVDEPDKNIDAKYVMNGYSDVYVSSDAIYFYQQDWSASRSITKISKMSYKDGIMKAGKSTAINGMICDSFAISQQKGYLYVIATENDKDIDVNTLHVFDSDMKQTGTIYDIARDESIYAARFIGDYAYFITYKQVDPLFVADISDPNNPKLLGELEVEGFSEYLHIWDENHVLGIGFITKNNARDRVKLTMFDVSDPTNPIEENYFVVDKDEFCNALYGNYKEILADPHKNLIGFAMDSTYELFEYNKENGFSIVKETNLKYEYSNGYRGLYSGDNFYIAGNGQIEYFSLKK